MEIKSSKARSASEANAIMAKRKEHGELGYEQQQALDNSEKYKKVEASQVKKLVSGITKGGKISNETATKIIDICPDNPATLRAILVKDRVELSDDEVNEILKELA